MLAFPNHGDFFKEREIDPEGAGTKTLDFGVTTGLLLSEIVGRKTSDHQAAIAIIAIELFQRLVLLGESTFRCNIDDEENLTAVLAKLGVFASDAAYGNVMDRSAHGSHCSGSR